MKKKQLILALLVLLALAALLYWGRDRIHFNFGVFRAQLALANWRSIGIGLACIYLGYIIRAIRWALLMKHNKKVPLFSLLGTQVIGFTAVALIGRVADLVRPYLVAKRTGLELSTQIAVYVVERLFDAGSMVLIFSSVILLAPAGSLPHPEIVKKAAYAFLASTVAGALFLVAVRLAGGLVASFFQHTFGLLSKNLGLAAGHKIRTFRSGLDTMRSFSEFGVIAGLSLSMWLLISLAYLEIARAFVASPPLASMTLGKCMLLLAASGGASVFQLPVLGWFTQIAAVAATLVGLGAAPEAATACAATLLLVTFLGIAPIGLVWARFEHVSIRKIASESEHASEELGGE
ncbi:MAG: lysylphosphatidylglycerol synthase transmembrane domain-containing protein [Terracidiphilus sp.]